MLEIFYLMVGGAMMLVLAVLAVVVVGIRHEQARLTDTDLHPARRPRTQRR